MVVVGLPLPRSRGTRSVLDLDAVPVCPLLDLCEGGGYYVSSCNKEGLLPDEARAHAVQCHHSSLAAKRSQDKTASNHKLRKSKAAGNSQGQTNEDQKYANYQKIVGLSWAEHGALDLGCWKDFGGDWIAECEPFFGWPIGGFACEKKVEGLPLGDLNVDKVVNVLTWLEPRIERQLPLLVDPARRGQGIAAAGGSSRETHIRGMSLGVPTHHAIPALLTHQTLFCSVVSAAVDMVHNGFRKPELGPAFGQIQDAVEVDPFIGSFPHFPAVGDLHAGIN